MIRKRFDFASALAGLTLCVCSSVAGAATISVAPSVPNPVLGSEFEVVVSVSGLTDGGSLSLGAFDVDVGFDPAILSPGTVEFGDAGGASGLDPFGLGSIQSAIVGAGSINVSEFSLDSAADLNLNQAGSFTLFRISFSADAVGQSALSLFANTIGDENGDTLLVTLDGSAVDVRPVPLPASFVLFAAGLLVCRRVLPKRSK